MKKILIVKGVSNTGKTTIINEVIDWVIDNYTNTNTITLEWNGVDRFGLIQVGNFRIGFISEGDTYDHVKKRLNEMHNLDCDVIVCACRTRLSSYSAVWEFINLYNASRLTYLHRFIDVSLPANITQTALTVEELETWLTGLEKI
ncbi:hypothetical protein SY27_15275 [Flavobacterium sp. 316]|uniref:hypothetical protein n=1 Tax=Flavobacterium sp. 316 TaxID=1603293 RepID=UPI0005E8782E|nr:hypothetical protein [Flavobacterium sp. 316]KIX19892.1 hypothetical protein SY27_15275 [Flavobacterium sp. 316]